MATLLSSLSDRAIRRLEEEPTKLVAYFLPSGERVFGAANPMPVLMRHVQEEPMPPSSLIEGVGQLPYSLHP
jgi:hypothetical protein